MSITRQVLCSTAARLFFALLLLGPEARITSHLAFAFFLFDSAVVFFFAWRIEQLNRAMPEPKPWVPSDVPWFRPGWENETAREWCNGQEYLARLEVFL